MIAAFISMHFYQSIKRGYLAGHIRYFNLPVIRSTLASISVNPICPTLEDAALAAGPYAWPVQPAVKRASSDGVVSHSFSGCFYYFILPISLLQYISIYDIICIDSNLITDSN